MKLGSVKIPFFLCSEMERLARVGAVRRSRDGKALGVQKARGEIEEFEEGEIDLEAYVANTEDEELEV